MKTSSCDRSTLAMLAEGLLPPAEAAGVRRHLEGCAPCREEFRQFLTLAASHRALACELEPASLPERVYPRVEASIRASGAQGRTAWIPVLAWSAAAMVVVALAVLLNPASWPSPSPSPGRAGMEVAGGAAPPLSGSDSDDWDDPSLSTYRRAWGRSEKEFDRVLAAGARTVGMGDLFAFRPGSVRVEVGWSVE